MLIFLQIQFMVEAMYERSVPFIVRYKTWYILQKDVVNIFQVRGIYSTHTTIYVI